MVSSRRKKSQLPRGRVARACTDSPVSLLDNYQALLDRGCLLCPVTAGRHVMVSFLRISTATRTKFGAGELRAHVLLLQRLDRIPVEVESLGNILDGGLATTPPHLAGNALAIEGGCSAGCRAARASRGRNPCTARDARRSPQSLLIWPYKKDARFKHPAKCLNANLYAASSHAHTSI